MRLNWNADTFLEKLFLSTDQTMYIFYSTLKALQTSSCLALKTILQGMGIVLINDLRDIPTKYCMSETCLDAD